MAGAALYYYFDFFKRNIGWALLVAAALYTVDAYTGAALFTSLWMAVFVFVAAFGRYLGNFARFGDASYGIYIIHFPVLQVMVSKGLFDATPWSSVLFAASIVTLGVCRAFHSSP